MKIQNIIGAAMLLFLVLFCFGAVLVDAYTKNSLPVFFAIIGIVVVGFIYIGVAVKLLEK